MKNSGDINGTWEAEYYFFAVIFAISVVVFFYLKSLSLYFPIGLIIFAFAVKQGKDHIDNQRINRELPPDRAAFLRKASVTLAFISAAVCGVLGALVAVFAWKAVQTQ